MEVKMKDKINEQIAVWNRIYKEQDDFYKRAAQRAGLSDAAYWVLYDMCSVDTPTIQSDLCKEWFFSKQTIHSAVTKLCQMGYVQLVCQNGVGNRKELVLTTQGASFCTQYVNPVLSAERKSFELLTKEERETMLQLMQKQLLFMNEEVEKLCQ